MVFCVCIGHVFDTDTTLLEVCLCFLGYEPYRLMIHYVFAYYNAKNLSIGTMLLFIPSITYLFERVSER